MNKESIDQLYRKHHLSEASVNIGKHNSRLACEEGQNNGTITPANYSSDGLLRNADFFRRKAKTDLEKACGACALQQACNMNGNIDLWLSSHPVAGPNKFTKTGEETRKGMLSRIGKGGELEPCDKRHIDPNLVPIDKPRKPEQTEQLKMAI